MDLYHRLSTRSRRAFSRLYKPRFARRNAQLMRRYYVYKPRGDLLARLAEETGRTPADILNTLKKERLEYLRRAYPDSEFKDWEVI